MNKITKAFCAAALCTAMLLSGCSGSSQTGTVAVSDKQATEARLIKSTEAGNSGEVKLESGDTYAVISIRDFGDIKIKLYPDLAPYSVYNFTELAKRGIVVVQVAQRLNVFGYLCCRQLSEEQGGKSGNYGLMDEVKDVPVPEDPNDPTYLTYVARMHLRRQFAEAGAGMTGANFGVAETGDVVVCTNEGNADMSTSIPRLHIVSMGIEKLVPDLSSLAVFQRLLARCGTGQETTVYTSHFRGPRPGGEMHIVLVDNGRSTIPWPTLNTGRHSSACAVAPA